MNNRIPFTHLHVHSSISIDGLGSMYRMVSAAKARGFDKLALTDHGSLSNAISFIAVTTSMGIKPIVGLEAYVMYNSKRYHLTMLADGNEGFKTLIHLNNISVESENGRPAFPLEMLRKYNKGIVVLTGCSNSPFHKLDWPEARALAMEMKGYLGNRLFAEIMFTSYGESWRRSKQLIDAGLIPILTNDVHFSYESDAKAHEIISNLRSKKDYESKFCFFATSDEIEHRVNQLAPEYVDLAVAAMRNADKLASSLNTVTLDSTPKLPQIDNANEILRNKSFAALNDLWITGYGWFNNNPEYIDRLEYELAVIKDMNFSSYFLILQDIISYAKNNNVRIGPGRGSGVGSLVLYLLNCTEIDPIHHGLSFERFLNPKRLELPDVDTDIDAEQRHIVLKYAKEKWGALPVATYDKYLHKSLMHDLFTSMHLDKDLYFQASDEGQDSEAFRKLRSEVENFASTYDAAIGQIKSRGKHAAGVVISDGSVPLPTERTSSGDIVVGWTEGANRELSSAGVIKFDLLGISALSVLARLERKHGRRADMPVDNDPVFSIFNDGDLTGIFQFNGSQGMKSFISKVKPKTFEDLIAINALYRPGPLNSGAAKMYPEWKKKPRLLHPLVDDILESTYGVICFQEQFMEIFARICDGDMADADIARKLISKAHTGNPAWELEIAKLRVYFIESCQKKGMWVETANNLWNEIFTHTKYSFNKSHAVAYASLAWETAWWKYHFRADFAAAFLSVHKEEWKEYLFDVVKSGIEVVPPHVNCSTEDFVSDGDRLYLPLTVIKHMTEIGRRDIIANQPYRDEADFMARVSKRNVNATARLGLWQVGAMEGMNPTASGLGVNYPKTMSKTERDETYMGLFLPDREFVSKINDAEKAGKVAGVVVSKEEKDKGKGKYIVYRMMPEAVVWSKNHDWLDVGNAYKMDVKESRIISAELL